MINGRYGNVVGTSSNPIDPQFIRDPSDGGDGWGDLPYPPDIDESANDDYGDLHLQPISLAINLGNNALLPADVTDEDADGDTAEPIPFDLDGNPRIQHEIVDIGAYEAIEFVLHPTLFVDADADPSERWVGLVHRLYQASNRRWPKRTR